VTLPVILRARAMEDVQSALDYLLSQGAAAAALSFVDALEQARDQIARQPGMGSPRHAHELNLPGLRAWGLARHPYLIFYFERSDHLDVWRVLHTKRDLAAWLTEPE
jgi:toxin ParE1/3/4